MDNVFIPPHNTIAPEAIAWFPPSLWLILLILGTLSVFIYVVIAYHRYRKHTSAQREAQKRLQALFHASAPTVQANRLLKQVAQTYYNKQVSALHGAAWVAFWTDKLPAKSQAQHAAVLTDIQHSLYQSVPQTLSIEQFKIVNLCIKSGLPKFSWLTLRAQTGNIEHNVNSIKSDVTANSTPNLKLQGSNHE